MIGVLNICVYGHVFHKQMLPSTKNVNHFVIVVQIVI